MILSHYVRRQRTSCSALPSDRVNQHTLRRFNGLLYEIKNSIARFILTIQHHLVILIKPEKRQISNSDGFPMIGNLLASAINDVGNFIGNYELYIL